MIKVLLLNPTVPPRAEPILNGLANDPSIDLTVFFYSVSARNRRWQLKGKLLNFKYKILKSFDIGWYGKDYFPFNISIDFLSSLLKLKPDVIVVPGWTDLSSYISAVYCRLTGKKIILRSESTIYEKSWRRTLFMPLTKFMVHLADAYIASGTRARDYLVKLGAEKEKIFIGYSTVDIRRFSRKSKMSYLEKNDTKENLGIKGGGKIIMFNGQLITRKGIYDLLKAFNKLLNKYSNIYLLLVGYGQEYKKIKEIIKNNSLRGKVVLAGFIENTELPRYYGIADIFVLPSREETWGIVVNEAMACGCPVVVGSRVGSSEDLVQHKKNGMIFRSGNVTSLYKALDFILSDKRRMKKMGDKASTHIKKFDLEGITGALLEAIQLTVGN